VKAIVQMPFIHGDSFKGALSFRSETTIHPLFVAIFGKKAKGFSLQSGLKIEFLVF